MSVASIVATLRELALTLADSKLPHEIPIHYPAGSPAEGATAGRFLLERSAAGARYAFHAVPVDYKPREAIAELSVNHSFFDPLSLVTYAHENRTGRAEVFLRAPRDQHAQAELILDATRPELGGGVVEVPRHPKWARWCAPFHGSSMVDLSHEELGELLLDNAEDLEEPAIADLVAQFRGALKIEADASLTTEGANGLRVTFTAESGAAKARIPRAFAAKFPAYSGAWDAGAEPMHRARFTLRVIPPKRGAADAMPTFRLSWINAADYEIEAARALLDRFEALLGETAAVYAGVAEVTHTIPAAP